MAPGAGVASGSKTRSMGGEEMAGLDDILEPGPAERLATDFVFTEGPSWHPDGFYYFVDIRRSLLSGCGRVSRARSRATTRARVTARPLTSKAAS